MNLELILKEFGIDFFLNKYQLYTIKNLRKLNVDRFESTF